MSCLLNTPSIRDQGTNQSLWGWVTNQSESGLTCCVSVLVRKYRGNSAGILGPNRGIKKVTLSLLSCRNYYQQIRVFWISTYVFAFISKVRPYKFVSMWMYSLVNIKTASNSLGNLYWGVFLLTIVEWSQSKKGIPYETLVEEVILDHAVCYDQCRININSF